jgi:transcriptional regulator with PAS, ATPase and Fis domain
MHGVANDLHEQRLGIRDLFEPVNGFERAERDVLFEIFIVKRWPGFSGDDVNESSNIGRIDFHFECDPFPARAAIPSMIGQSSAMQTLREKVRAAARVSGSVLVTGESGTGKELVARSIHEHSERCRGKFVAVDCGALPDDLIESELFGHRRGAFTTAVADKPGLFEEANGGTLFLDEIANTSRRFQAKLLRVLQDRQLRRLGDVMMRKLDLRVIAATNCELMTMVRRGEFREDLYYRLNVFPIQVPPLRRRLEDVPLIADHILRGRKTFGPDAMAKLINYRFPGNIRELENIVEASVCMAAGNVIEPDDVVLPHETIGSWPVEEVIIGNFWDTIARPYSERLITKNQVENVIRQGLERTRGSYKKMLPLFRIPESDYKRFMDFLRRHNCNLDFRTFRKK